MYRLFLIAFLLFIANTSIAAVFVVTSNADAGPGTLREALTLAAANGSAEKDYINFNIADLSEEGRTITISSVLPTINGNLVIDGITQPGTKFGVSDAKVVITTDQQIPNLNAFNVYTAAATGAIEFYGLYIRDFYGDGKNGSGIGNNGAGKLIVGAPGRGNVISGNNYAIAGALKDCIIQANFLGVSADGVTPQDNQETLRATADFNNLLIGGNDIKEGNIIENELDFYNDENYAKAVNIINNSFGTDYTGKQAITNFPPDAYIYVNGDFANLNISKNVFAPNATAVYDGSQSNLVIKGNFFGVDRAGESTLGSSQTEAIALDDFVNCLVGGDEPGAENIFANYGKPFFNTNSQLEVIRNSFRCNMLVLTKFFVEDETNYVRIIKLTDNYVSGDAPPGAKVQLYFSTASCNGYCNPDKWFATVTSNSNGVWEYSGPIPYHVMASSTVDHHTFGMEPFNIKESDVIITNIDCHHPGSIKLKENREGKFTFTWTKGDGTIVSHDQNIDNLTSGSYKLQISEEGSCPTAAGTFGIADSRPHIEPQTQRLNCNTPTVNFTIYDNTFYGIKSYTWLDKDGNKISAEPTLKNVGAGVYYAFITDNNDCNSETEKYEVLPPVNAPVIDESQIQINGADCGLSNGSITGIKVSGSFSGNFGWSKSNNTKTYYNQYDLKNVPPGKYYFFINYTADCTVTGSIFTVESVNGITIDDSQKIISMATCQYDNGSISNIQVTGATKYSWYNSGNNLVSTELNLTNVPTGNYHLIAANDNGCTKQTAVYAITRQVPVSYALTKTLKDATCNENNGSIELIFQNPPAQLPESYKWVKPATGEGFITSIPKVTGIDAGKYDIYITTNGCELYLISYTIGRVPGLTVVTNNVQVNDDHCAAGTGSITGIQASGATPLSFAWTDDNGINKGISKDLLNVPAGTYHLKITDGSNCEQGFPYTIHDQSDIISPPNVSDVQLCSPGDALLSVSNADSRYGYRLYEDNSSAAIIDEQQNGRFKINVRANRSYFISQYTGNCESSRAEVKVVISGISGTDIANTFTPNGDGINDYWKITGIENSPNSIVQVFNRNGQKLFESKGYANPFDGKFNGKLLPSGTYYYIINMGGKCNLLSGSVTIIR